ncbi:hypothetical protein OHC33_004690 [Knufia fluminis]|uniref:Uncharacterized protein n=1 Tax=Knufia fluminis TaxID=191047 RepID=A0AAN8EYS9_9EURO|nr:hypothetical protein OHC33_004690 [Knufia fluminis]
MAHKSIGGSPAAQDLGVPEGTEVASNTTNPVVDAQTAREIPSTAQTSGLTHRDTLATSKADGANDDSHILSRQNSRQHSSRSKANSPVDTVSDNVYAPTPAITTASTQGVASVEESSTPTQTSSAPPPEVPASTAAPLAPLQELPAELRQQMLATFAGDGKTLDFESVQKLDESLHHIYPVWEEFTDFLRREKKLYQLVVYAPPQSVSDDSLRNLNFHLPPEILDNAVAQEYQTRLASACTMKVEIGHDSGGSLPPNAGDLHFNQVFVYTKSSWLLLCKLLSWNVDIFQGYSFTIEHSHRGRYLDLMQDWLFPLGMVRYARNVSFAGMMGTPALSTLSRNMTRWMQRPEEWHDMLVGMQEELELQLQEGRTAIAEIWSDCHSVAVAWARQESRLTNATAYGWHNSPAYNSFSSLVLDAELAKADIYRKHIKDRIAEVGLVLNEILAYKMFVNGINVFAGMSKEQRMRYHYHQGHRSYYAAKLVGRGQRPEPNNPFWTDTQVRLYKQHVQEAARGLYLAWSLDNTAMADAKVMFDELEEWDTESGAVPGSLVPTLTTIPVPAREDWVGDPELLSRWGLNATSNMIPYFASDLRVRGADDLGQLKTQLGIAAVVGDRGRVRFLV